VSELADHKVESPEEIVKPGQELEVKILRVDVGERKIGLSLKRVQWAAEEQAPQAAPADEKPAPRLGGIQHVEDEASLDADGTILFGTVLPVAREADAPAGQAPQAEAGQGPQAEAGLAPEDETKAPEDETKADEGSAPQG